MKKMARVLISVLAISAIALACDPHPCYSLMEGIQLTMPEVKNIPFNANKKEINTIVGNSAFYQGCTPQDIEGFPPIEHHMIKELEEGFRSIQRAGQSS